MAAPDSELRDHHGPRVLPLEELNHRRTCTEELRQRRRSSPTPAPVAVPRVALVALPSPGLERLAMAHLAQECLKDAGDHRLVVDGQNVEADHRRSVLLVDAHVRLTVSDDAGARRQQIPKAWKRAAALKSAISQGHEAHRPPLRPRARK